MLIAIIPYTKEMEQAVREFNNRLSSKGVRSKFPETCLSEWLPKIEGRRLYQEYFLAIDENKIVRGAYILKHQDFFIDGKVVSVGDYQLPISEGIIDRQYGLVAVYLYNHAISQNRLMYGLGIGSYDENVAKFFRKVGWSFHKTPFYYKILKPQNFLANITYLRKSRTKRIIIDIARFTGIGYVLSRILDLSLSKKSRNRNIQVQEIEEFDTWVDDLWQRNHNAFSLIAVRDTETLQILYPKESKRFIRLKVTENNRAIGWAVLLCTQMSGHRQFGNMRVGSIVDCFCDKGKEWEIVSAALDRLKKDEADIIISNQAHIEWGKALNKAGFLGGPSNFIFATSKELTELINPCIENLNIMHLTRGDGDGPIHL